MKKLRLSRAFTCPIGGPSTVRRECHMCGSALAALVTYATAACRLIPKLRRLCSASSHPFSQTLDSHASVSLLLDSKLCSTKFPHQNPGKRSLSGPAGRKLAAATGASWRAPATAAAPGLIGALGRLCKFSRLGTPAFQFHIFWGISLGCSRNSFDVTLATACE